MAQDTEYLTGNRKIRYPFADDSVLYARISESSDSSSEENIRIPDEEAIKVFGCLVDACIQLKSVNASVQPKISEISLSGHTLCFTLTGSTQTGSVRLTCTRTSERYPVIYGKTDWCWYSFVLSSAGIREYEESKDKIGDISITTLDLNDRCIGKAVRQVSSIMVYGGTKGDGTSRYTRQEALLHDPDYIVNGDLVLKPGFNMTISDEDGNPGLNAIPGSGEGLAPCGCTDDDREFKSTGLICSDGHVRLFNDTCYDVVPTRYSDKSAELSIHVKCKACCTCGMYESIVNNRLIPLRDEISGSKESLESTFAKYEENVKKWNDRIARALPEDIVTTITGVTLDSAATNLNAEADVHGKMDRCGFSVTMRNDSFVNVTITVDSFSSNGSTFEAQVSYMSSPSIPVVIPVNLDRAESSVPLVTVPLEPGRSATLTYFVRLGNMVRTDHQHGFMASMQISAYQGSSLITRRSESMAL